MDSQAAMVLSNNADFEPGSRRQRVCDIEEIPFVQRQSKCCALLHRRICGLSSSPAPVESLCHVPLECSTKKRRKDERMDEIKKALHHSACDNVFAAMCGGKKSSTHPTSARCTQILLFCFHVLTQFPAWWIMFINRPILN